jgi:hypothetical protein
MAVRSLDLFPVVAAASFPLFAVVFVSVALSGGGVYG